MRKYEFNPPIYKTIGYIMLGFGLAMTVIGVVQYFSSAYSFEDKAGFLAVFGMIGIVSITIGAIILFIYYVTENIFLNLIKRNEFVIADITAIKIDHEHKINGLPTHYIECEWTDPLAQKRHYFRSRTFFLDHNYYIPGTKCKVFCDSTVDYTRYYVDVDWLLETKIKREG